MGRKFVFLVLFMLSLTSGIAGLALKASAASEKIGVTATVRNIVSQIEPRAERISVGDEVIRDEVVHTAADSDARFVLRDDTNFSLGPGSTLKLDRTVFDDPKPGDIAIKLVTGTFRFVTGHSDKQAYVINTPVATMGVRGTTLDIQVERRRNVVVLRDGQAHVCITGKCVDLLHIGDSTVVTVNGSRVNIDLQTGSPPWTFDNACNGGLCGTTTFAQAGQNSIITGSLGTAAGGGGGGTGGPTAPGSFAGVGGGGGGGGGGQTAQGTSSGGGGATGGGGVGGGGGGFTGGTSTPAATGSTTSNSP